MSSVLFLSSGGSTSLNPALTGPDKAYLHTRVAFRCAAPDYSPPVTFELMRDDVLLDRSTVRGRSNQPAVFIQKVAATSEGSYQCKATAGGRTGVSNIIKLSVVSE